MAWFYYLMVLGLWQFLCYSIQRNAIIVHYNNKRM